MLSTQVQSYQVEWDTNPGVAEVQTVTTSTYLGANELQTIRTFGKDLCGNQPVRRVLVRNRHRHAIEQASRRWRGGRKILLSTRLRTAAPPSLSGGAQATSTLSPPTISSSASVGADGTRSSARAAANNTSSPRRGCIFWCLLFGYVSFAFWAL